MKFWPFYGERWTAKTAHLNPAKEGIYLRLCIWAMTHEKALPLSLPDCYAVARATTGGHRSMVRELLGEFFSRTPEGYHQKTIDEVLMRLNAVTVVKRDSVVSTRARVDRYRKRRNAVIEALQAKGITPPATIGIQALRELCITHGVALPDETRKDLNITPFRVTRNARIQNPVSNTVTALPGGRAITALRAPLDSGKPSSEQPGPEYPEDQRPGPLRRALDAMQKAGLEGVHPAHPLLGRLLDAGLEPRMFYVGAREAVIRGKGFAWALATMAGRIEDQARAANGAGKAANGRPGDLLDSAGPLVPPEALEALARRLADPNIADPWELPPLSPSEGEPANEIKDLETKPRLIL